MRLKELISLLTDGKKQYVNFDRLPNLSKKKRGVLQILKIQKTPLFIADQEILANRLEQLKKSLNKKWKNHKIAYSFKTNYRIAELVLSKKEKLWAEVVSGKEYSLAKKLGYKGKKIVFNGPHKTKGELKEALANSSLIFIDNLEELYRIEKIAQSLGKKHDVGIRINPTTRGFFESRFGFRVNTGEAKKALNVITKNSHLNLAGLHIHLGTDIDDPFYYKKGAKIMSSFIKEEIPNYKRKIKYLDFGGGYPASGLPPFSKRSWNPRPIDTYLEEIVKELKKIFARKRPTLIVEPGRYLVDDAVFFVTKIINSKKNKNTQILTTDATITMLPLIHYRPQIISLYDEELRKKGRSTTDSMVYGASCREDDILFKGRLPRARAGDFLVYYVTGAYNQNMSSEFIFKRPKTFLLE